MDPPGAFGGAVGRLAFSPVNGGSVGIIIYSARQGGFVGVWFLPDFNAHTLPETLRNIMILLICCILKKVSPGAFWSPVGGCF